MTEYATIYHGTPLTPRAALLDVCAGRPMCVSFYHPQDVEVVEAISPAIMFRQRRFFGMDGRDETRRTLVHSRRLDPLLSLVGAKTVRAGALVGDTRRAGCPVAAQRRTSKRLAVWTGARRPALAHGRADQSIGATVRAISARCFGVDWAPETRAGRMRGLSTQDGRGCRADGQHMAPVAHDARDSRCLRLPFSERRQHIAGAEWAPI